MELCVSPPSAVRHNSVLDKRRKEHKNKLYGLLAQERRRGTHEQLSSVELGRALPAESEGRQVLAGKIQGKHSQTKTYLAALIKCP